MGTELREESKLVEQLDDRIYTHDEYANEMCAHAEPNDGDEREPNEGEEATKDAPEDTEEGAERGTISAPCISLLEVLVLVDADLCSGMGAAAGVQRHGYSGVDQLQEHRCERKCIVATGQRHGCRPSMQAYGIVGAHRAKRPCVPRRAVVRATATSAWREVATGGAPVNGLVGVN